MFSTAHSQKLRRIPPAARRRMFGKDAAARRAAKAASSSSSSSSSSSASAAVELFDSADVELYERARREADEDVDPARLPKDVLVQIAALLENGEEVRRRRAHSEK